MTVQNVKTKAEQALLKAFEDNADRLPGGAKVAARRRDAIGAFAATGLPSRRVEEWKYTDLKVGLKDAHPLAGAVKLDAAKSDVAAALGPHVPAAVLGDMIVFADGRGHGKPAGGSFLASQLDSPPDFVGAALGAEALAEAPDLLINTALFTDGAVIDVPANAEPDRPVTILSVAPGADAALVALRHVIRIGAGAKVTLVEIDRTGLLADRQTSALTQIEVGAGAEVAHIKLVETKAGAVHLGHWHVTLGEGARYEPFQMTIGEGLVRHGLYVGFDGPNGTFDYGAASVVHGQGHADCTMVIDHKVPHCTSRELFKAVLDGKARAVFQGKVIVRPDAQKTDGKQMAQALMLSPDAEFDSKPELEIYADDVACGHGSTAAEIDPDLVFYCTSRGIPAPVARALLIESFIGEAIEKVAHDDLRAVLFATARASLGMEVER